MKIFTVNNIMDYSPCEKYTYLRLKTLAAGREQLSVLDILRFNIPVQDCLYILRELDALDDYVWIEFAVDCVERMLPGFRKALLDKEQYAFIIKTVKMWRDGDTPEASQSLIHSFSYYLRYAISRVCEAVCWVDPTVSCIRCAKASQSAALDNEGEEEKQRERLIEIIQMEVALAKERTYVENDC